MSSFSHWWAPCWRVGIYEENTQWNTKQKQMSRSFLWKFSLRGPGNLKKNIYFLFLQLWAWASSGCGTWASHCSVSLAAEHGLQARGLQSCRTRASVVVVHRLSCPVTCIQISQEAGQVVWYSHLLKNFPQFVVLHTNKWVIQMMWLWII